MKIKILLFGIATDLIGESHIIFEIESEICVLDLKNRLQSKFPKLTEINSYAIAVNESYASGETLVKSGDVVAIIPPVSGG